MACSLIGQDSLYPASHKFCTLQWQDEIFRKFIRLTHLSGTGKSEIRTKPGLGQGSGPGMEKSVGV
ncbi:MAG: hypothetical protein DRG66_07725 [Deltaproteobacteria bacterium]|nr:MAG: hypothetical protein DRG66_07725 [Deltaproteobacteria bacterium]